MFEIFTKLLTRLFHLVFSHGDCPVLLICPSLSSASPFVSLPVNLSYFFLSCKLLISLLPIFWIMFIVIDGQVLASSSYFVIVLSFLIPILLYLLGSKSIVTTICHSCFPPSKVLSSVNLDMWHLSIFLVTVVYLIIPSILVARLFLM